MSEELNNFKIEQLNFQVERLANAVDKICGRIEQLEKESFEKGIYRKFVSFLYMVYPAVMLVLIMFTGADHKKISDVYENTQSIIQQMTGTLKFED